MPQVVTLVLPSGVPNLIGRLLSGGVQVGRLLCGGRVGGPFSGGQAGRLLSGGHVGVNIF